MSEVLVCMDIQYVRPLCGSFLGVIENEQGASSNIVLFSVSGKKYAYYNVSNPKKWRFSIRVTPERFLKLTGLPGVKPARYRHAIARQVLPCLAHSFYV
ncbi:hypothetical protein [Teredinibacter purpureus]|uniref:hypothetical protein n=1 Tax=Teredinibacter purpureus TaxID=2731756 RepID=UPI0013C4B7B4|nr:hypothetical protein [Teredinibacter purpureus]